VKLIDGCGKKFIKNYNVLGVDQEMERSETIGATKGFSSSK